MVHYLVLVFDLVRAWLPGTSLFYIKMNYYNASGLFRKIPTFKAEFVINAHHFSNIVKSKH